MQELIAKIEELRKSLAAMKPKGASNSLVPALQPPTVKPLSMPTGGSSAVPKLPGVSPASNKDPKKMAEQLKNPRPKKPKIEMLKFDKNGQWSLERSDEDKIRVSHKLSDLTGKGTEYLIHPSTGEVRAKFHNGNLPRPEPTANVSEPTVPTHNINKFGENNTV